MKREGDADETDETRIEKLVSDVNGPVPEVGDKDLGQGSAADERERVPEQEPQEGRAPLRLGREFRLS